MVQRVVVRARACMRVHCSRGVYEKTGPKSPCQDGRSMAVPRRRQQFEARWRQCPRRGVPEEGHSGAGLHGGLTFGKGNLPVRNPHGPCLCHVVKPLLLTNVDRLLTTVETWRGETTAPYQSK